jgi:hypothetical protein
LDYLAKNWLLLIIKVVSVLFYVLYVNYFVLALTNYFGIFALVSMLIVVILVHFSDYKSKKSNELAFAYIMVNILPFYIASIYYIFKGDWTESILMKEAISYTLFLIPQGGCFSAISMMNKQS